MGQGLINSHPSEFFPDGIMATRELPVQIGFCGARSVRNYCAGAPTTFNPPKKWASVRPCDCGRLRRTTLQAQERIRCERPTSSISLR